MSIAENFLNTEEEKQIIETIQQAERLTSGEIRVHIDQYTDKTQIERAQEVFYLLKMNETRDKNGILFHISIKNKAFSIIGDEGIDKKVPLNFWNDVKDQMTILFKKGCYTEGLIKGIQMAGESLQHYFPYQKDDINELPDEISKS
ncbi:MAG: TPM domain-containing protein [Flavobacteriales bacterium]